MVVTPKKTLGQHFLTDEGLAKKIADTLSLQGYHAVLEIGPGMGMLTKHLLEKDLDVYAIDIDPASIRYLRDNYLDLAPKLFEGDFLTYDLNAIFGSNAFALIGNYPYNISTQIVFKTLAWRRQIPEFSGMFQKEVAQRICSKSGSKTYGILSVLTQAFYDAKYLFTVPPTVFNPPPKVMSGVLKLTRKNDNVLPCNEALFFKVVKATFQQRRKTLRNSLKAFGLSETLRKDPIFSQRPEQLSVSDFVVLTSLVENEVQKAF